MLKNFKREDTRFELWWYDLEEDSLKELLEKDGAKFCSTCDNTLLSLKGQILHEVRKRNWDTQPIAVL